MLIPEGTNGLKPLWKVLHGTTRPSKAQLHCPRLDTHCRVHWAATRVDALKGGALDVAVDRKGH